MDPAPLAQVAVLVVEDHHDTREFLQFVLLDAGALVQTAGSAAAARGALTISMPDVAIVDLGLPDEDGYTVLRAIRVLRPSKRVWAIAATARASSPERDRALAAGFDAYLVKPFPPEHLIDIITALVPRDWR